MAISVMNENPLTTNQIASVCLKPCPTLHDIRCPRIVKQPRRFLIGHDSFTMLIFRLGYGTAENRGVYV